MNLPDPFLCRTPCDTCDKQGLPLLLVRRAVVPSELPMPAVPGPFTGSTSASIPLGSHAKYTQRLLRSGYVYVYDERYANQWDEYFVTEDGYLAKLPRRMVCSPIPPKPPTAPFTCARTGARPMASVITIPNAKHAKTVWIGFSDVQWTDEVMKQHNSAAHRAKHLTQVNVSGGKVAAQKHTLPLEQVKDRVPEYAGQVTSHLYKELLGTSPFQFNHREGEWQNLMSAYKSLRPDGGGAVVMVRDPVGIALELGQLMHYRVEAFKNRPEVKRQLFVSSKIAEIKIGVIDAAQAMEFKAAEKMEMDMLSQPDIGMLFKGYRERRVTQIQETTRVTPAQLDRIGQAEWKKYTVKFDEAACNSWTEKFGKELESYEKEHTGPLAEAHAKWMQSEAMVSQLELNHDEQDYDSGVAYADILAMCIVHTQDKTACHAVYDKWLKASAPDRKNLLLNALLLNQKLEKEQIKQATTSAVDWNSLPWDKLIEGFGRATAHALAGRPDVIGKLIGLISGSVVGLMTEAAASGKLYYGLVAMGVASGKPMLRIEKEGTKVSFRRVMFKQMRQIAGNNIPGKTLDRVIDAEVERLKALGVDLTGNETRKWLLMLDPEEIKAMPPGLTPVDQAKWVAARYKTAEDIQAINLSRWRTRVSMASNEAIAKGKAWSPSGYALLGLLANLAALSSIQTDDAKVLKQALPEAMRRYYAQWAQVIGAGAQAIEALLQKLAVSGVRVAIGLKSIWGTMLRVLGRTLGAGGSLAMSAIDGMRAWQEVNEKNYVSAASYAVSAGLGILATAFLFLGWTPAGLIIVGLLFLWAFLKPEDDNKIQDWLERVYQWGKLKDQQYPSMEMELQQFEVAIKV